MACLLHAAVRWHVSYRLIVSIARCESGLNPHAYNPAGAMGVMQFMAGTWRTTPYARHSVWSARWNTLAGAWLIHVAGTGPWTASRPCWA